MVTTEERAKNKRLTDFDDLRDFVIANSVKGMPKIKKDKNSEQELILDQFQ